MDFGKEYTDRNILVNESTREKLGISKAEIYKRFLCKTEKIYNILEVGCNRCEQLQIIQHITTEYIDFYGIDINKYALMEARLNSPIFNVIEGSALDIPFKNNYFDLVFTSGVLIHIDPMKVLDAIKEIIRVSKKYIWGYEYYAPRVQSIQYRGNDNVLWKDNFREIYQYIDPNLKLIKEEFYTYQDGSSNVDTMFLLEKV